MKQLQDLLADASSLSQAGRVALFNEIVREAANALLHDLPADPATRPQLVHVSALHANDYNPNRVASPELALLEQSMTADGITMPVVVSGDAHRYTVVDGFHRRMVASTRLMRTWIPCSIIEAPRGDLMASTVRHNRARGKHQVDLQGALVVAMSKLGMSDDASSACVGLRRMLACRRMHRGAAWPRATPTPSHTEVHAIRRCGCCSLRTTPSLRLTSRRMRCR